MNKIKLYIGLCILILSGFIAYGLFTMPRVKALDSEKFSAERVAGDIKVISKEPHSIEHPFAREKVREYLAGKLQNFGGDPQIFPYDSIASKFGGHFDIANVYCDFPATNGSGSYVLLVAHYDSRFAQNVLGKTVYSFGAADDGYGVGVILELLNCALKYRDQWSQGIKILFTDSEEHELDGAKMAMANERAIFEGVNFVINIEARGVKGPALLFETSQGNRELMKLYKKASFPYTYSLTTFVYNFLPNFTDFTELKKELPGYNFSVIDNLHYYHTDKDNFSNISLRSIQHYGSQLEPVMKEYLCNSKYAAEDIFRSQEDSIFFTIPLLGLFSFSKSVYMWLNIITLVLFAVVIFKSLRSFKFTDLLKRAAKFLFIGLIVILVGEGIAFLAAKIAGTPFNITSTKFIYTDWIIIIASFVLLAVYLLVANRKRGSKSVQGLLNLLSVNLLLAIFSGVMFFTMNGENFFFMIPLLLSLLALIYINPATSLIAVIINSLLGFSFLYCLITALSIGSLGIVLFIGMFYLQITISLFDCYLNAKNWRKESYY